MLSRLTNISKLLALTAAALLIVISVHGIFLHHDSHVKAGESHPCTLCEIHTFHYTFPGTCEFVAKLTVPVVSYTYREHNIFITSPHRLGLRGPPVPAFQ